MTALKNGVNPLKLQNAKTILLLPWTAFWGEKFGRCTAELGEVDAMVNVCKEADRRSQHYAKKVLWCGKSIPRSAPDKNPVV